MEPLTTTMAVSPLGRSVPSFSSILVSSTMTWSSPVYSSPTASPSASSSTSSFLPHDQPRYGFSCVARGAVAPMPSLMSHPPLLQTNPQTHLVHRRSREMRRRSSPPLPSWPPRTPSPSSSSGSSAGASQSSKLMEFQCSYCNQVYKKVGYLNRHVLTHSGTRFRCNVEGCDRTFSRRDNMRTHVKNMHPEAV